MTDHAKPEPLASAKKGHQPQGKPAERTLEHGSFGTCEHNLDGREVCQNQCKTVVSGLAQMRFLDTLNLIRTNGNYLRHLGLIIDRSSITSGSSDHHPLSFDSADTAYEELVLVNT
jgi:hypothetical protein